MLRQHLHETISPFPLSATASPYPQGKFQSGTINSRGSVLAAYPLAGKLTTSSTASTRQLARAQLERLWHIQGETEFGISSPQREQE